MAMSSKLAAMDYNDFVGAHGGRRTKALAGRFRRAKGMQVTPEMQAAVEREAMARVMSQAKQGMGSGMGLGQKFQGTGGGADDEVFLANPGKPLPGVTDDMLGPPDAPRVGGRTQPGTTPRPGFTNTGAPKPPGVGGNWISGQGRQTQPEWPPTGLRPRIPGQGTRMIPLAAAGVPDRPRIPGQGTRTIGGRKRIAGQGTRSIRV